MLFCAALITGAPPAVSGVALAQALANRPAQPPEAQPKFRSSVDMVSISAVVRDRKGRFVRDLAENDFIIAEAGQPRRIIDFQADSDGPVNLVMLVDVSGSMRVGTKAAAARQTASHLLSALRPTDRAALFAFDTRLERVSGFTSDFATLESALNHIDLPFGQTSVYDAVAETARILSVEAGAARAAHQSSQRSAIVVLTDGIDTRSRLTAGQVSGLASAIDVPVYVVALMSPVDDPSNLPVPAKVEAPAGDLRSLARWTGGELFTASAPAHASIAARQIVDELRHQYVLGFEASAQPGWRPLEVRARDRDLTVRARTGYTAGESSGNAIAER